jgi:hypothetical protein
MRRRAGNAKKGQVVWKMTNRRVVVTHCYKNSAPSAGLAVNLPTSTAFFSMVPAESFPIESEPKPEVA